jgi:hypothetical protein
MCERMAQLIVLSDIVVSMFLDFLVMVTVTLRPVTTVRRCQAASWRDEASGDERRVTSKEIGRAEQKKGDGRCHEVALCGISRV